MTDRVNTLTVVLEHPVRTDDVEEIIAAIRMVRGVLSVEMGEVDGPSSGAGMQERTRLWQGVVEVFYPPAQEASR